MPWTEEQILGNRRDQTCYLQSFLTAGRTVTGSCLCNQAAMACLLFVAVPVVHNCEQARLPGSTCLTRACLVPLHSALMFAAAWDFLAAWMHADMQHQDSWALCKPGDALQLQVHASLHAMCAVQLLCSVGIPMQKDSGQDGSLQSSMDASCSCTLALPPASHALNSAELQAIFSHWPSSLGCMAFPATLSVA